MRKVPLLLAAMVLFLFAQKIVAQEKFIDVRQAMADSLTSVKTAVKNNDWDGAFSHFQKAKGTWEQEVKPMITDGVKTDTQYKEYFDRIAEIGGNLNNLAQSLEARKSEDIEPKVNAIIWGISHHPRGFAVPKPRYTTWDWVFGLGIGIGFCLLAIVFGLYLRKSYYRRYKKIAR
jgi:hypothetical protein